MSCYIIGVKDRPPAHTAKEMAVADDEGDVLSSLALVELLDWWW